MNNFFLTYKHILHANGTGSYIRHNAICTVWESWKAKRTLRCIHTKWNRMRKNVFYSHRHIHSTIIKLSVRKTTKVYIWYHIPMRYFGPCSGSDTRVCQCIAYTIHIAIENENTWKRTLTQTFKHCASTRFEESSGERGSAFKLAARKMCAHKQREKSLHFELSGICNTVTAFTVLSVLLSHILSFGCEYYVCGVDHRDLHPFRVARIF